MSILGSLMRKLGVASALPPLIAIPLSAETAEDFFARVSALIGDGRTHVYLDTSMLMWLTKIGDTARSQVLVWLEANCRGRLHVPIWAAHEYFRHHVGETAKGNLDEAVAHLRKAAGVYGSIHPYLDEQLGVETARRQQSDARQVLTRTAELADVLGNWGKLYQPHATAVLEFVNRCCIEGTNVFDSMGGIEATGTARYAGRLPPGFRDMNKKESVERKPRRSRREAGDHGPDDAEAGGVVGHNRWGDLIFWREILEHARGRRARAIVILTNDRKNDWYMGGGSTAGMTAEMQNIERLKPIPRPHPVLAAEARATARIADVVLLDSPYLALLLRRLIPDASDAFTDVALVQKLATTRSKPVPATTETRGGTTGSAPGGPASWKDDPALAYTRAKLRDAITLSRAEPAGRAADLVTLADAALASGDGIAAVLNEERLSGADVPELVTFAREVGDRARVDKAGWVSAASDLAGALPSLPHKTAGSLFFGLLLSAHFARQDNSMLLPPSAPFLNLLWDFRSLQHFSPAITAIRDRTGKAERRPLYVVGDADPLAVIFEIDADGENPTDLRQLRLGGHLLLQSVQFRSELRLRECADGVEKMTGEHIVKVACEAFGIPFDAVIPNEDFGREYSIRREIGFKDPALTYIMKPEAE